MTNGSCLRRPNFLGKQWPVLCCDVRIQERALPASTAHFFQLTLIIYYSAAYDTTIIDMYISHVLLGRSL